MKKWWENYRENYPTDLIGVCACTLIAIVYGPLFLGILLYAAILGVIGDISLFFTMQRQKRILKHAELWKHLSRSEGTVIVENPTLGWNINRLWWTPDNARALSPVRIPPEDGAADGKTHEGKILAHEFAQWALENYTDPQNGRAFLVALRRGDRLSLKAKHDFPEIHPLFVWSGGLELFEAEISENDEDQNT